MSRHYIVSDHPTLRLAEVIRGLPGAPFAVRPHEEHGLDIVVSDDRIEAKRVQIALAQMEADAAGVRFFAHTWLLDRAGLDDFIALRGAIRFTWDDIKTYDRSTIDLEGSPLRVAHRGMNGVAIVGERSSFGSALDFFVHAAAKMDAELGTDSPELLDGGAHNPVSLATVERRVCNACSNPKFHFDVDTFVSAIQFDYAPYDSSACFFVETTREYLLLDLYCP